MRSGSQSAVAAIGRIRSCVPHHERGHVDLREILAEVGEPGSDAHVARVGRAGRCVKLACHACALMRSGANTSTFWKLSTKSSKSLK